MISTMIKDSSGKLSSTRIVVFLVVIPIMLVYMGHNLTAMLTQGTPVGFSYSELSLLTLILGTKVATNFTEKKSVQPPKAPE